MTRASDTARLIGAGATINDGTTITTADNDPQLILTSTDADGDRGPVLQLKRDSGSPADNDTIGRVQFLYDDDGGNETTAVQIEGTVPDVSDGSEDASLNIVTMVGGNTRGRLKFTSSEAVFNEDSEDLDFRVEGNGNTHDLFVQGGSDFVGIGNDSPNSFGSTAADLVIGTTSGEHGLSIVSGTGNGGRIQFADNTSSPFRGAFEYNHAADEMIFYTGGAEGMRLSSSGNLSIGNTDNVAGIKVFKHLQSFNAISCQNGTNNDGGIFISFLRSSGTIVGSISQTNGGANVLFNTSSDYRLKENVEYNWDATTRLKELKPCRFNFKGHTKTIDGFLAHEVTSVPESVTGTKDATEDLGTVKDKDGNIIEKNVSETHFKERQKETTDLDGNKENAAYPSTYTWEKTSTENVYQTIDHSKLVPLLVKTIQELEARITVLESK